MPNSGTVTAGSAALASQYNNLRDDVLNTSTGHTHTGASENGAKVEGTALKATGVTDGYLLTADGSGGVAWEALAAAGADVQEFTSSGSWVKPAGKSAVYVLAIGGGGGGASGARNTSTSGYGGHGGGGGAHSVRWFVASTLAGTVTVTIGAGGTGGTAAVAGSTNANGFAGLNGGDTSFGTAMKALGGRGGNFTSDASNFQLGIGVVEYGWRGLDTTEVGGTANRTSDESLSDQKSFPSTDTASVARQFNPGRGARSFEPAVRAMTRTGGGGSGGYAAASPEIYNGTTGARGFGYDGTNTGSGGTASGGAGSSATEGLGSGGGGGGGIANGTAGNGGNGYLGGGGGGGGGAYRSAGDVRGGAGGNGGGGYVLVISV